jgi:hypothetical protein
MSDMIDLTNRDLGIENLGEVWEDFIARCVPEHGTLYNESYNLIAISFPNSFIDNTLNQMFIDEGLDTADLMAHVRLLFINTICDALQMIGVSVDKDYIDMNSLEELKRILDTVYLADGLTDLIGVADTLTNEEMDTKERFIEVVKMVSPEYDFPDMESYIKDVDTNVIRGLLIGLNIIDEDDTEYVDHTTKTRIRNNKALLIDSLGGKHIKNGGAAGLVIDSYMKLFITELADSLVTNKYQFLSDVLSLMIISSLTDRAVEGQFNSLVEDHSVDIEEAYRGMEILKGAVLDA